MNECARERLLGTYRDALLHDVVPFWMRHSLDEECGGYFTCLDRDGSVYHTDKYVWLQARQVWTLSRLYLDVEARGGWLNAARLGAEFLKRHAFDYEGRMHFQLARDGTPLFRPWNIFTETFGVVGFARYAQAAGDEESLDVARRTYEGVRRWAGDPRVMASHAYPAAHNAITHAVPMILIATARELQAVDPDPEREGHLDQWAREILTKFVHRDIRALLETVGQDGSRLDSPAGRVINPGHAIESAWFLLELGRERADRGMIERATEIILWSLDWGWDEQHGGLLSFVDCEGKPPEQLEWDMKMWWPHTESLYALLLAHELTGDARFEEWHARVHEWTFRHFPDPEHGEWFGYLNRAGEPSILAKGGMWKGMFHVPRALLFCWKLLQDWGFRAR